MAKFTNSFRAKGELDLERGVIYETKKEGKEEIIVEVDLASFLREFDGRNISVSIVEDKEVTKIENVFEENDEE